MTCYISAYSFVALYCCYHVVGDVVVGGGGDVDDCVVVRDVAVAAAEIMK